MRTIFKNGTLVTELTAGKADLLIEGEKVIQTGDQIRLDGSEKVIDASGLLILPGGVDAHVHLDLPMFGTVSSDDHYTGMKAAAFGGTTTVIDFVSQDSDDLIKNVSKLRDKALGKAAVDFGFHANITHLTDEVAALIPKLAGEGVTSVKVFTAYNNRLRLQDGDIFRVMRIAQKHGILTMLHAENGDVIEILVAEALQRGNMDPIWHARTRPAWGATESVARAAALSAMAEHAPLYIVHMNAAGEVDMLAYAQEHGLPVFGETCPQYLFFSEEELTRPDGAKWICSPPMRTKRDQEGLWKGIDKGIISVIATDHCPFFFDGTKAILFEGKEVSIPGKELGKGDFTRIPNGLPGVGDRMPIMFNSLVTAGRMNPSRFVALTSTNPAKLFGIYPQKGTIQPGSDADIVLWDPALEVEYGLKYAQHRTDHNLYEGWKLRGFPVQVYSRGELIVDRGTWLGKPGRGKFLSRKLFDNSLLKR